jgi:hypothetical protein
MTLDDIFFEVIEEANIPALRTTQTKPIVDAIKSRNRITFYYTGPRKPQKTSVKPGYRVKAEPVAIGLNKKGNLVLRAWIDNPSQSKRGTPSNVGNEKANYGWRTFRINRMSAIQVLKKEIFNQPREKYNGGGDDKSMTVTYVKAKFGTEPEQPQPKVTPTKKAPTVNKQTKDIDKQIAQVQNDYDKVTNDLKANGELIKQNQATPEYQKYLQIGKELTAKKKELEKQVDDLASQIGKDNLQPTYNVNKFIKTVSSKKNEPAEPLPIPTKEKPPKTPATSTTTPQPTAPKQKPSKTPNTSQTPEPEEPTKQTLPQPKKKEKPDSGPNGEEPLYESVFKRIKTLMSKI